ncbi:MAG: hypothetical protein RMM31_10110, partial [Anaerolineae bacterium]|nr:hypothetical protein [Anaerolineae bacterium]
MSLPRASILAALSLLVLLSVAPSMAERAYAYLQQEYQTYASPFLEAFPSQPATPTYPSRVVVIWVRGLSLEAAQRAPALDALRRRGASAILEPAPPSWRPSVVLTLLSGATPAVHGALAPGVAVDARLDTLFHRLRAAERPAALIADPSWAEWFEDVVPTFEALDSANPALRDDQAVERALALLRPPVRFAFVLVELGLPEASSSGDLATYAAAVAATEVRIQFIVQTLDFNADALVVIGEPSTTHGADLRLPMVMVGPGVLPNTAHIARATDVAPTLAVLAGTAMPAHAQGAPIFEALAPNPPAMILSARQLTTFYEAWSERMASQRFAATLLREHESALASGDARAFSLWQAQLRQAAQHQLEQRLTPERLLRLPLAAGIMLLWAALCVATLRAQTAGVAVIGAGVAVGVWSMFFAPTAAFDIRAFEAPLVWAEELALAARICFAATGILCAFALRQREVSP